ncbi:hypothetical protein FACS1894106_0140 [Spirochaetia bacterium]|nr:hypothetical protein FACS1894106_0140 [Spirochaetia bacterium]
MFEKIMRKVTLAIAVCYLFFGLSGSLFGIGEKTFSIGGSAAWRMAESRSGIIEMSAVRPHPVLALAGTGNAPAPQGGALDLALSFDEGRPDLFTDRIGHYRVIGTAGLAAADLRWARAGNGAALFSAAAAPIGSGSFGVLASAGTGANGGPSGPLVLAPRNNEALFAEGRHIRDFSIEFWLYPLNMENGEQMLSWISYRPVPGGKEYIFQRIQCAAFKNRLQWNFQDFFSAPGGEKNISLTLNGNSPVVPKTWSHHLIRFDSDTGLLEYLVNGKTETIAYASASGREGGEVYIPIIGEGGNFVLGSRFSGLMDEFRIQGGFYEPGIQKYAPRGGRMETRAIDLGEGSSGILKLEASGGRITLAGDNARNEYSGQGDFRFSDNAAIQFFIRAADNPYIWTDADWRPVMPGTDLSAGLKGRYVQIAADFYPSEDGETSPYLEEIRIVYRPDEPRLPPARIMAVAADGAVELSWRNSPSADTSGYLVYYGLARGDYFGESALLGASPIDVGKRTGLRIDGLENGRVYYFAVAAYTGAIGPLGSLREAALNIGEFSWEVSARPLKMAE